MTDGLVDRQPQIGRIEDDRCAAGFNAGGCELLGEEFWHCIDLRIPVPPIAAKIFEAAGGRWG